MSETEGARGIPEIAICDGCDRGGMLRRINAENQLFSEALEEETGLAELQQGFMEQATEEGNSEAAALHEQLRNQHAANVAGQASNVQGEVAKISRLNALDCETAIGGQPECARYLGYAAERGGVNVEILKAEERGEREL